MAEPFQFARRARRPGALALVATALGFLGFLVFGVVAHPVLIAVYALLISPAIWEIFRNARASLTLDSDAIAWQSGGRGHAVALADVDRVNLRTTLDFSQRATIHLKTGQKLRIPAECLPGGRALDHALDAQGVTNSRSLFGG